MPYSRRKFIKISGGLTTGFALGSLTGLSALKACGDNGKIDNYGLQLWTLREDMPKDPKGVLKQVASFGYKHVESFEGPKGMFWGMSNTDFRKYINDLGMTMESSHCDINKDFEKKAAEAAAIGVRYLTCAWLGPQKSLDEYKKKVELFNKCAETCKKAGIRFAYHNHDYSFTEMDGQFPQDIFMTQTDASMMDFEMDIYWVVTAGQDPEDWFKRYKNRFRLCHIKDRMKDTKEKDASCTLGTGIIDFDDVLETARKNGMQYYIVEQERYEGTTPIKAVEADATYVKNLDIG